MRTEYGYAAARPQRPILVAFPPHPGPYPGPYLRALPRIVRPPAPSPAARSPSARKRPPMARIVLKFGGTSVGDIDRIKAVAAKVKTEVDRGNQVAVVVSAMAGRHQSAWSACATRSRGSTTPGNYDTVVSSGEQVTVGLLAMALQAIGVTARSWLGLADPGAHGRGARQGAHPGDRQPRSWTGASPPARWRWSPGFQGNRPAPADRPPLGRGGSDTSAVALAAAPGRRPLPTSTPTWTASTRPIRGSCARRAKLNKITYEEMLEMASLGAKVLQTRSVEMAMKHRVRLQVLSSFEDKPGTLVVDEDEIVEQEVVSGITYSRDECKLTLVKVPGPPGRRGVDLRPAGRGPPINVDMIVQNVSEDGESTDMTFTVGRIDLARAVEVLSAPEGGTGLPLPPARRERGEDLGKSGSGCAAMPASPSACSPPWPRTASTSR